jgi:AcrR family transcriptional regulator
MVGMQADAVTERTGGRSARIRSAALGALKELLVQQSADSITTSEVARRSGVNRSTLHRRWGGMSGLLADLAIEELNATSPVPDDAGDLRTELLDWAGRVVSTLNEHPRGRSPFVAAIASLEGDGGAASELLYGRVATLEQIFVRAAARGDHVALTAMDLVEIVLLPIYAARLLSAEPVPDDLATRLVDRFLTLNKTA